MRKVLITLPAFFVGCMSIAYSQTDLVIPRAGGTLEHDIADGQKIANLGAPNGVTACFSCHGMKGEGIGGAGFPRLAGQSMHYLNRQLTLMAG